MTAEERRVGSVLVASVAILQPRAWNALRAGLLYFAAMTIFIVWIGHRAGYYAMAGQ